MTDDSLDIAGSSEDAGETFASADSESIPEQEVFSEKIEAEELSNDGSGIGESGEIENVEQITELENSSSADTKSSEEEQENSSAFDIPSTADSSDDLVSYISVPSGYDVIAVANIPNYTNALLVLIFAVGSLLGFMFARIASWR